MARQEPPKSRLVQLAESAVPSPLAGAKSPLDLFFAPGSARRAELESYLNVLRTRGVRITALQVYLDLRSAYPNLPVAGDSVRRWLTRNYPTLLPWK